jgi:AbrB family looped-hinge helix DNA binding protein
LRRNVSNGSVAPVKNWRESIEMKVTVSSKGQIVLPAQLRRQDGIEPGQQFEITRLGVGDYLLTRTTLQPNESWVDALLACPVKDWFVPMDRTETTDSTGLQDSD